MARELLKLERLSRNTRRAGDVMVKAKNSKQANINVRHWSCCDCDAGIVLGGSNNCQDAKKSHPLPKMSSTEECASNFLPCRQKEKWGESFTICRLNKQIYF